jgi:hypothetical protein
MTDPRKIQDAILSTDPALKLEGARIMIAMGDAALR